MSAALEAAAETAEPLLRLRGLSVELARRGARIRPVVDVELEVDRGETLAVLGESGSGKTLTALSLIGLLPARARPTVGGTATFDGRDLLALDGPGWRRVRGSEIAMIFQDPLSALNPAMRVGDQIAELFRKKQGLSRGAARLRTLEVMEHVRIADARRRYGMYPHQFSGGMRQRAMIGMAIALGPRLLIADEPTTALDVTVQAEIIELLGQLQRETGMAILLITHDLSLVGSFADRVTVMYAGRTVESGETAALVRAPSHPYTRGLRESIPRRDGTGLRRAIAGAPPDPAAFPEGCAFHPRCPRAETLCAHEQPPLRSLSGRLSRCHFAEEVLGDGG